MDYFFCAISLVFFQIIIIINDPSYINLIIIGPRINTTKNNKKLVPINVNEKRII